jgi:hypothetical protein
LTFFQVVEEKCIYKCDPNDASQTVCIKQAHISSPLFGFSSAMEQFGLLRFKKNADKASKGLIFIIEKIKLKRDTIFNFTKS